MYVHTYVAISIYTYIHMKKKSHNIAATYTYCIDVLELNRFKYTIIKLTYLLATHVASKSLIVTIKSTTKPM